jgi:proteic killer suppression protein
VEFRHAGLRRFWERGDPSRLNPAYVTRIARILDDLAAANDPTDMAGRPSRRLHQLAGDRRGTWSVRISGNWRLTFRFENGEAVAIDLEDYH